MINMSCVELTWLALVRRSKGHDKEAIQVVDMCTVVCRQKRPKSMPITQLKAPNLNFKQSLLPFKAWRSRWFSILRYYLRRTVPDGRGASSQHAV